MRLTSIITSIFHPNRISAYGAGLCAAGTLMVMNGEGNNDIYGTMLIATGYSMDYLDGQIARRFNMKTKEGARFDSLVDKVKNVMVGGYIGARELMNNSIVLPVSIGINFVNDFISQRQRGTFRKQASEAIKAVVSPERCESDFVVNSSIRANYWGKSKAVIQMGCNLAYLSSEVYQNHVARMGDDFNESLTYCLSAALLSGAVLGGVGTYKRVQKGREFEAS